MDRLKAMLGLLDDRDAERDHRSLVRDSFRAVERMRHLSPSSTRLIDPESIKAEVRQARALQAEADALWPKLTALPSNARARVRRLLIQCSYQHRCLLIEIYKRPFDACGREKRFMIVAFGGGKAARAGVARRLGDEADASLWGPTHLAMSCQHGHGYFPLAHPGKVRTEGPGTRRLIEHVVTEEQGANWRHAPSDATLTSMA